MDVIYLESLVLIWGRFARSSPGTSTEICKAVASQVRLFHGRLWILWCFREGFFDIFWHWKHSHCCKVANSQRWSCTQGSLYWSQLWGRAISFFKTILLKTCTSTSTLKHESDSVECRAWNFTSLEVTGCTWLHTVARCMLYVEFLGYDGYECFSGAPGPSNAAVAQFTATAVGWGALHLEQFEAFEARWVMRYVMTYCISSG